MWLSITTVVCERQHGARLRFGDAADVDVRRFTRVDRFVGVRGPNVELETGRAEQFGSAGRGRGKQKTHAG
jgi:hypothetical protein